MLNSVVSILKGMLMNEGSNSAKSHDLSMLMVDSWDVFGKLVSAAKERPGLMHK